MVSKTLLIHHEKVHDMTPKKNENILVYIFSAHLLLHDVKYSDEKMENKSGIFKNVYSPH